MIFSFIPKHCFRACRFHGDVLAWNILLSNILLLICALVAAFAFAGNLLKNPLPSMCLVQRIFHIPCPGCGITHGILYALSGNLRLALQSNPVSLLLIGFILIQIIGQTIAIYKDIDMRIMIRVYHFLQYPLLVAFALFWGFRILFPNVPSYIGG